MRVARLGSTVLAGCAVFAGVAATPWRQAAAAALLTEAPNAAVGNAQGPAPFRYYGTTGSRVQEVFSASFFGNFGGPRAIEQIAFRTYPGAVPGGLFGDTVSFADTVIRLSTTDRGDETGNTLSATYADNVGADARTVYSGALTLTTANPGSFDYVVNLATPFVYDPSKGNLLLDVTVPLGAAVTGNGVFGFVTFDNVNTLNDGIYSVTNIFDGAATSGILDTSGAIAQFTSVAAAVPEPAGMAVLGVGLLGLVALRRQPG